MPTLRTVAGSIAVTAVFCASALITPAGIIGSPHETPDNPWYCYLWPSIPGCW